MEKPAVLQQLDDMNEYSTYKSGIDGNGIATEVDLKRKNGTLILKSVLSEGTSPAYASRVETYYAADGVTPIKIINYLLAYDTNDNVISEVMQ